MEQASYLYMMSSSSREKEIKGWRREKKNKLVESMNPTWKDLAADWYPGCFSGSLSNPQAETQGPSLLFGR
jgi:hypothetical protein